MVRPKSMKKLVKLDVMQGKDKIYPSSLVCPATTLAVKTIML